MTHDFPDPNRKVRLVHHIIEPTNGPGQLVSRPYNREGNPFIVFCSHKDCEHYWERPLALPFWSEDCRENLGVLRCLVCGHPVIRQPRD